MKSDLTLEQTIIELKNLACRSSEINAELDKQIEKNTPFERAI